jgi:hypothetical protein
MGALEPYQTFYCPYQTFLGALSDKIPPFYQTFLHFGHSDGEISEKRFFVSQKTNKACDFTRKPC